MIELTEPDVKLEATPLANYRPCAAMVVADDQGRTLLARRKDIPDAWQYPQGGIDIGESPTASCLRELREETGLDETMVAIVAHCPFWISYDFPESISKPGSLGQIQAWFLLRLTGSQQPDLTAVLENAVDDEIEELRWAGPAEAIDKVVDFKEAVYVKALSWFAAAKMSHLPGWAFLLGAES